MNEDRNTERTETKETKKGRGIWRLVLIICAVIIAAAVVLRLLKPKEAVEAVPLPTVSVTTPQRGDIELETSLIGTVMPDNIYYVIPKVVGEIKEIYVSTGDSVNEGDPICLIDNHAQVDSAKIQLDSANVQLNTAAIALDTAKTSYDRMSALYQTGDISKQNFEQAKMSYEQAKAQHEAAKLAVDGAKLAYDLQVEYSTVTAPVSGIVESTNMELNNMATQSSQVCVISGSGTGKVQFSVTDRLLPAIKIGEPVRMEKQSQSFEGVITSVENIPSQQTGLYPVEASIENADQSLITGSGIKVYFVSEKAEDVLTLPQDSIYYDGGKTYVYTLSYNDENATASDAEDTASVAEANRAATVHKVEVETGLSDDTTTEIKSGISDEDMVIKSWTAQLYEGAQVQALPKED